MLSSIIKVIIIIVMIAGIGWCGLCVYSNVFDKNDGTVKLPDADDAAYSLYIENTGNLILTDNCETFGTEVGSRTFVVKGFWQVSGTTFKYNPGQLILDEKIFGKITLGRRK